MKTEQTGKRNGFLELIRDTFSLLRTVIATVCATFIVTHTIIANAVVPSSSMERTIMVGDRIIGLRITGEHRRGDIVVFRDPDGSGMYLIKRIIGMPGDSLEIRGENGTGSVYINGEKLEEPYLPEPMKLDEVTGNLNLTVPEGSYFCMGDNRNNSYDARYWKNRFIKDEDIIARSAFTYWPLPRAGITGRDPYGGRKE